MRERTLRTIDSFILSTTARRVGSSATRSKVQQPESRKIREASSQFGPSLLSECLDA